MNTRESCFVFHLIATRSMLSPSLNNPISNSAHAFSRAVILFLLDEV